MAKIKFSMNIYEDGKLLRGFDVESQEKINQAQILNFTREQIILISQNALKEEQTGKNFPTDPIIFVDKKKTRNLKVVKPFPDGQIEFVASDAVDAKKLLDLYFLILSRSPVGSGLYLENNLVIINEVLVAKNFAELKLWLNSNADKLVGARIIFVNVTPYARSLEIKGVQGRGKTQARQTVSRSKSKRAGQTVKIAAPNGAYFLAARAIARANPEIKPKFTFIPGQKLDGVAPFPQADKKGKKLRTSFAGKRKSGKSRGRYLYPSIVINLTPGKTRL